jgi:hypothetical protein
MGKSMLDLLNEGKEVTSLDNADLLLAMTDPAGTPDDAVIEWDSLQDLIVMFQNYQIVPSVSSNNLTVAIKALDGNDPSSDNQVKFKVGNSVFTLSAAASFTITAGTNWMNMGSAELAGQDVDLFVYAIAEGGTTLRFGVARIPYAETMLDLANGLAVPTHEKAIIGNHSAHNTTDSTVNIGRIRARLSGGAGYTWSMPNNMVVNRPIYETDWLEYTFTPTCGSGAFTSVSVPTARYRMRGREVANRVAILIIDNGTADGYVGSKVPMAAMDTDQVLYGKDAGQSSKILVGSFYPDTSSLAIANYDSTYPGATDARILIDGFYEI